MQRWKRRGEWGRKRKRFAAEKKREAPYADEITAKAVAALKEVSPDYLISMQYTGFRALAPM